MSGYKDFLKTQPLTSTNLYQIGSITKSFIAAIILQLESAYEPQFNINHKLSVYFPEYPQWGDITIKQLLNMTSGIPDYLAEEAYLKELAKNPSRLWRPVEQVNFVVNKPLLFVPGERWGYSNTNYILLDLLIKKLTGHSAEEEINYRFLRPDNANGLNLSYSQYNLDYPAHLYFKMVHGYRFGGNIGKFVPLKADVSLYNLSYAGAAGAMVSNTQDINQWVRALFSKDKILPAKQLKELTSLVSTKSGKPIVQLNKNDPNGFGLGIGASYIETPVPELIFNFEGMTMGYRAQYIYIHQARPDHFSHRQ